MLSLSSAEVEYNALCPHHNASASGVYASMSIQSDESVSLVGPQDIHGSVRSTGGSIHLSGDFTVRDKIEAYGNLDVNGSLRCRHKAKIYGNMAVDGYTYCGSKITVYGTLTVHGQLVANDNIEVYGAVVIQGYMKCKSFIAYASVTTIGDDSYYEAEETETIYGAKMVRRTE